jgi:hypothetical protein
LKYGPFGPHVCRFSKEITSADERARKWAEFAQDERCRDIEYSGALLRYVVRGTLCFSPIDSPQITEL